MMARSRLDVLAGLLVIAYLVAIGTFANSPYGDMPGHLVRASFVVQKLFGEDVDSRLVYQPQFSSYFVGDVILGIFINVFGWRTGSAIWSVLAVAAPLFGLLMLAAAMKMALRQKFVLLLAASVLFTSTFFVIGFHYFQIASGLAVLAFAFALRYALLESAILTFLAMCLSALLSVLIHPAPTIFLVLGIGLLLVIGIAVKKVPSYPRALAVFGCAVLVLVLGVVSSGGSEKFLAWGGVENKLVRLLSLFPRYERELDVPIYFGWLVSCLIGIWLASKQSNRTVFKICLLFTFACLSIYFLMPRETTRGYEVDSRALFFFYVGIVVTGAGMDHREAGAKRVFLGLIAVSALNLVTLIRGLSANDAESRNYLDALHHVFPGSNFLPIETGPFPRTGRYLAHSPSLGWFVNGSLTPYLFSATNRHPQGYFDYADPSYKPDRTWARRGGSVDWRKVELNYDYLVQSGGGDIPGLPPSYSLVYEKASVRVFRVKAPTQ
jgi:hypothetical protein